MSISKQSLPKRVISLLLAVAIMIGFVPLIDIDLTAFAATYGCIELDDNNPKSGDNWVWDNTTKTLSLYNAKITRPDSGSYAIKYDGTDTLKINQIGYNHIENGYIQAENGSIEVVGSGILDISHDSCYMFNTPTLKITNGYVRSDDAVALNSDYNETTIVSNCVLDIPQAKIVAYAQPGSSTAGFIMESGYVNCKTLKTGMSAVSGIPSAEIKGGYLKVGTIDGEYNGQDTYYFVKLGTAVVKADTLTGAADYLFSGGNTTPTTLELNGSTLLIKNTNSFSFSCTPQETIGDYNAYYGTRTDRAKYYNNDTPLTASITTTTIVCDNNLTLSMVDTIPAGTTIYCGGTFNYTTSTYDTINGCLIGKVTLNVNATVGSAGRIYGESLTLNGNATIAEGGAVTVYNSDYNTKCLNFNSNSLTVNGDFSVKSGNAGFGETEKNITVGAAGQFAAFIDVGGIGSGFDSAAVYNAITTGNDTSRTVYASNSYHGDAMDCKKYDNPNTVYIGKEFKPQLISLDSTQIICKKVYEDSADLNFLCSHNIEDLSDVKVTITTGGGSGGAAVTDKFNFQTSYSDTTEADKTKIKITLSLKEDIDAKGYEVAVSVDGLTATSALTAKNINTTLDFTKTNAGAWEFFGEFGGTSVESKATPASSENSMWAWYPNGAEGYTGKVLVLNGLEIETTAQNAIIVPADTTIVVKGSSNVHSKNTAISCKGNVTIAGAGSSPILTAESDYSVPNHYAAIQSSGDITIKNISLHTSMGECDDSGSGYGTSGYSAAKKSYGIYGSNVHLIDVSGECKADDATEDNGDNDSAAICALSTIFIDRSCALTLTAYTYALESATLKSAEVENLVGAYNSDNTATYSAADINSAIGTNNVVSGITIIRTFSHANSVNYNTKSNVTVTIAENDKQGGQITCSAENGTPACTPSTTEPDTIKVTRGADLTIVFTANQGYYIKTLTVGGVNWVENGRLKGSNLYAYGYDETTGLIIAADVLFRNIQDNVQISVEYAAIPTSDPPQSSTPHTAPLPVLDGTGYSYARMAEVLATYKTGSTATIETNGNYDVPEAVIKAIANGKLKVTIIMDSVTSRYIDGADIETVKSVDADVRRTYSLDTDELSGNEAMQLILFKFDVLSDLIIDLNAKNAGLFANLYKYTNGEFEFADCAKINKDGKAVFEDYTTSGTYAIMLSEYSGLLGDMNNDGKLNAADATAILKYVVGLDDNSKRNLPVADFDGNGKINARDAVMVLKRVVGLI